MFDNKSHLPGAADLTLHWPDRDGRLLLQLDSVRDGAGACGAAVHSCVYAGLSCDDAEFTDNLEGELGAPVLHVTLPTSVLREAVEDCEWVGAAQGGVRLTARAHPQQLKLTASSPATGALAIAFDTRSNGGCLSGMSLSRSALSARYAMKSLRVAACMPPSLTTPPPSEGPLSGGSQSRVVVDGSGIMKITHLLCMAGPTGHRGGGGGGGGRDGFRRGGGGGWGQGGGGTFRTGHPTEDSSLLEAHSGDPHRGATPRWGGGGTGGAAVGASQRAHSQQKQTNTHFFFSADVRRRAVPVTFVLLPREAEDGDEEEEAQEAEGGGGGGGEAAGERQQPGAQPPPQQPQQPQPHNQGQQPQGPRGDAGGRSPFL